MHERLAGLLGPGSSRDDMLCFASAGNTAQRHWYGPFHAGSDGCHEWEAGHPDNVLTPWENEQISVEMCWQPGADYDLTVHDDFTGQELGCSRARPGLDRCCAVVHLA